MPNPTTPDVYVSSREWYWVILVSGLLAAITLIPYAWAFASSVENPEWTFMGILANPQDGATYISKIKQGYDGALLFRMLHTPEPHEGSAMHMFYIGLGHLAKITGFSPIIMFHLARVAANFFMYIALYLFGATVWRRMRPRRLFFTIASIGSGLGWLLISFDSNAAPPDLTIPEAFPLYAAYTNPHFPIAIGCLALLAATYLQIFRPGFEDIKPQVNNGGLTILIGTLVLSIVQPQALVGLAAGLGGYLIMCFIQTRKLPLRELYWIALMYMVVLPFGAYYLFMVNSSPVYAAWNEQNITLSPSNPLLYAVGYGMLLVIAIPGMVRALRRFEADGDRLMLTWLVINALLLYFPFNLQRRLAIGITIPLVYFGVRALEDYWFHWLEDRFGERGRVAFLVALFVLIMPSNILAMGVPLFGVVFAPDQGLEANLIVERGYWNAMIWLDDNGSGQDDVVLSSSGIGLWIPAASGQHVVYGHPYESIDAETKLAFIDQWYNGVNCQGMNRYDVNYVIVGPRERAIGESANADACYADRVPVATFDRGDQQVAIYKIR